MVIVTLFKKRYCKICYQAMNAKPLEQLATSLFNWIFWKIWGVHLVMVLDEIENVEYFCVTVRFKIVVKLQDFIKKSQEV